MSDKPEVVFYKEVPGVFITFPAGVDKAQFILCGKGLGKGLRASDEADEKMPRQQSGV